ncbi:MAG TPA: MFS transporter [Xanthobacteraceae bacterium]|jgi:putative MFS transporter|nr:MFS transporter [Xanthobacteraceae bacterium]
MAIAQEAARINIPGRLERLPMTGYQRRLFAIVATAWLADQVDVALLVFLIGDLKEYFHLTPVQIGYLASMTFLGQLVGNLIIGSFSDLFGRRIAFQTTMIIWGLASFLAAGAWSVASLMVFRFLIGVGVGGEAPVAQAVLSEIIPANVRAKYIAFMEGFWAVGFIISGTIAYFLLPIASWRWVFVVVGLLSLVVFWVRRSLLESPRWLADRGRYADAETVMKQIEAGVEAAARMGLPPPRPFLAETMLETRNPFSVLLSRFYLRANVMSFSVWFFALLGFYGLTSWLAIILGQHGFSVVKSIGFITLITFGGIPGFYTAAILLERIGRKLTTAAFLFLSALMAYIYGHSTTETALFVSGFIMQFFMFGMWSCLYAYTPELYPTRARALGAGMASAFGRVGAISGPIVVGYIIGRIGDAGVFSLGAASFAAAALIVLALGIETRGRSVEEICRGEERRFSEPKAKLASSAGP